jgi:hypothetical protein
MTTYEQLTLDFPTSNAHAVVYHEGDKPEVRIPTVDLVTAASIADNIVTNRPHVTWDDAPKVSGLYGLESAQGGAIAHRVAIY